MRHKGQTVLITGASSGIALALVQEGFDVYGAALGIDHMTDIKAVKAKIPRTRYAVGKYARHC